MLEFAEAWISYGGAPDEEIFVRYGMTRGRFIQQLWRHIDELGLDMSSVNLLALTYPLKSG